jgi:predicted transcriptional regulator
VSTLIIPCEVAVKSVVPSIKALLAIELVEKHGMTQEKVAELLGISQSAVSKYTRKVRGYVIKVDEMVEMEAFVDTLVSSLVEGAYQRAEFLASFCQMCRMIRKTGLMCQFCEKADTNIKTEECDFCTSFKIPRK